MNNVSHQIFHTTAEASRTYDCKFNKVQQTNCPSGLVKSRMLVSVGLSVV